MREFYHFYGDNRPGSDRALSSKGLAPMSVVCFPNSLTSNLIDNLDLALDLSRDDSSTCYSSGSSSQKAITGASRLFKLGNTGLGRRKPAGLGRLTSPQRMPWLHHQQLQVPRQEPALDFLANRRLYHLRPYNSVYPEFNALMDPNYPGEMSAATASIPQGTYSKPSDSIQSYTVDQPQINSYDNLRFNQKSLSELDRRRQHRLNQRDSKTSLLSEKEKGLFEREKTQLQDPFLEDVTHSPLKHPLFKPTELRNNYVTGHQLLPPRNLTITPEREQEDIISMGSTWGPSLHVRNTSIPRHSSFGVGSSSMPGQLSVSQAPIVTGSRRVNRTSSLSYISGRCQPREDQGYADPLIGAPASLQQRLSELAGLEAETIRWERTKKTKKKTKDS